MDKRKRHYSLDEIKRLAKANHLIVTLTAQRNALEDFALDTEGLKNTIIGLTNRDFYKSMTTLANSTLWQDVYLPYIGGKQAYIKMQIVNASTVVIQFKGK